MNTLELLQRIAAPWLSIDSMSQLSSNDASILLSAVNGSVRSLWPMMPFHYKQKDDYRILLAAPRTERVEYLADGTTAALGNFHPFDGPLHPTYPYTEGWIGASRPVKPFQKISAAWVDTDWSPIGAVPQANRAATRLPVPAGIHETTIQDNTSVLPFLVEQVISCRNWRTGQELSLSANMVDDDCAYTIHHLVDGETERHLFWTAAGNKTVQMSLVWAPRPLTIIDTLDANEIEIPSVFIDILEKDCGAELLRHPRFRTSMESVAVEARASVSSDIKALRAPRGPTPFQTY